MRKVLSFVLVLTLVLSSLTMAFAATPAAAASGLTDVAGNANADAIQVNYDLGIVTGNPDGTFLPEKAVTRAEFAALITRALDIPASALAGYTTTSFKDTTGYGWATSYLAFCQSKGIMIGDGNGNVMPGRTISVNEAMTMALRAIGYTSNSSMLVGAWPANYVSIAQNNDLYSDVASTTTVNKASAAQIIYNLLTVQKVSVNSDGTTAYLTNNGGAEANLLNTNLGCTSDENVILGDNYNYDNSIINITNDIGAYGTAYLNSDDNLVAFTKDSTALTGKVNDDKDGFVVGDVTYDFGTNAFTSAAAIANTDVITASGGALTATKIDNFAAAKADNGDTVTLNVDLSGKKIKDIYSVVAWKANDAELAASDVQSDIADSKLLGNDFAQTDNNVIDTNSFELVGVASLDKIAKDNVVYVYTDGTDIRKVAVGTETLTGTIDEINDTNDTLTIAGKDYDVSPVDGAATFSPSDVGSDGTFSLDANGAIFDFDGTATADTYGVVKAATAQTSFDNYKVKLYTSDDATKTLNLSEANPADIDWTSSSATTIAAVTNGALIGYSLDSNGDIDAINNTVMSATGLTFKSAKVLGSYSIDPNAVVFTYDTTITTGDYGVAKLADIDAGTVLATSTIILNEDGDVAAMLIAKSDANIENDAIYGVVNARTTTTNSDGDNVYKFTGFIDGTAFTYKTDDQSNDGTHAGYTGLAETFGLYAVTLDSSNQITKIDDMAQYVQDTNSGWINSATAQVITALSSDNTVITIGTDKYSVADDAVVYKYSVDDKEFTVSKLSSIDKGDSVQLFDTKGSDANGEANVVIYHEN